MRLSRASNAICKNCNIETLEERFEMRCNCHGLEQSRIWTSLRRTFVREELLLRRCHFIYSIESKTKLLRFILGIGYPHDIRGLVILAIIGANNYIFVEFLV